jgi:heme/copper-type cytochrome/quinol oxidase subunit 2
LRWIALVATLILVVPAMIAIVRAFWPFGSGAPVGPGRALEAVWTIVPAVGVAALVAYSVAAR